MSSVTATEKIICMNELKLKKKMFCAGLQEAQDGFIVANTEKMIYYHKHSRKCLYIHDGLKFILEILKTRWQQW